MSIVAERTGGRETVRFSFVAVCLAIVLTLAGPLPADQTSMRIDVMGGIMDRIKFDPVRTFGLEAGIDPGPGSLRPFVGWFTTGHDDTYGYVGAAWDFRLGEKWALSPSFAAGRWERRRGVLLGGPLEFKSALAVEYRVTPRSSLALSLEHLSNSAIYERNPGVNLLLLRWILRFRPR